MINRFAFILICILFNFHLTFGQLFSVEITANDLTEDFSVFSSKDDEVIVFIFDFNTDTTYKLIDTAYFEFDEDVKNATIDSVPLTGNNSSHILILLLEQDSWKSWYKLVSTVDENLGYILKHLDIDHLKELKKVTNNEDIIGLFLIEKEKIHKARLKARKAKIEGINLFDEFNYGLLLEMME